ncbi:MAG: hypothetical protein ETSY1_44380 [Candidatus Entotheonella factor]|uniref:Glycoside hydrolase family 5 domain-containing protein n=1 Tax=Entotheonella factor TaxID=1429438 RepID=W4L4N0_ENTF1|nr:MAG: hypothetical protein ETSY1_44380 [Candidatus Entotheonella factor]
MDTLSPPRIVYSPHVYFDFDNDSDYSEAGEETGPIGRWEYYVRDRLIPAIDWSIDNNVPMLIGETNVPCTADWAEVLDFAFSNFFEPLHFSVTIWNYINPQHDTGILNVLACEEEHQLNILAQYPGGTYQETAPFPPNPSDSIIYNDELVNPWSDGSFNMMPDFCANPPVFEGDCAIAVDFNQTPFAGLKFNHQFGVDTRRLNLLEFQIWLTAPMQPGVMKIFTTAPLSDCDDNSNRDPEFPPFELRRDLTDFIDPSLINAWQQVRIPLDNTIVDPAAPIMNGFALQSTDRSPALFYLDAVDIVDMANVAHKANQE